MFVYTVYGNLDSIRTPTRRVEPVAAVEPTRRVNPSWRAQYGNSGQPQRIYPMQQAQRAYVQRAAPPESQPPEAFARQAKAAPAFTSEVSAMQIQNLKPAVLEQRRAPAVKRDGEYIRKYVQSLNEARSKTVRQRQRQLELTPVAPPPDRMAGGVQNVLANT